MADNQPTQQDLFGQGQAKKPTKESRAEYMRRWKAKQDALGLCRKCVNPAAPGKHYCTRHLEDAQAKSKIRNATRPRGDANERQRRNYHARIAKGMCGYCTEPPLPGRSLCQRHAEEAARKTTSRRRQPFCSCGAPKELRAYKCKACNKKMNDARMAMMRERVARGECMYCGQPHSRQGRKSCQGCADRLASYHREKRQRLHGAGVCVACTSERAVPGNRLCTLCYVRTRAREHFGTRKMAFPLLNLFNDAGGVCPYTGRKLTLGVDAELDHRVPLAKGGANTIDNVRWVHVVANQMKADMLEDEFFSFVRDLHAHLPPDPARPS